MLVTSIFSFFPPMFSSLSYREIFTLETFNLSSASVLNLDYPKIMSFGKEFLPLQVKYSLVQMLQKRVCLYRVENIVQ